MKRWSRVSVAAVFCGLSAGAVCQQAQSAPQNLAVTIDASQTAEPVSRYEYGMFIEHIRTLIYRSLWSEMLDDRKFASGITSKPSETAGPASGPFRGMQPRLWRPVGGDGVVTMDKEQPFVGEQSPRIQLDASAPHGIRQAGFALVKGKRYTGHIWLRGTPGAKVSVALIWGEGPGDRQNIAINKVPARLREVSAELHGSGRYGRGRARDHRYRLGRLPHRHRHADARG